VNMVTLGTVCDP